MSFIDHDMVAAIGNFPFKRGSFEIENYLFGEQDGRVNPGCLVLGSTVCGDMKVGTQNWLTYSVPVMAYLVHTNTARVPTKVKHTQDVTVTAGYSSSFTAALETEVKVEAGFAVAVGASLKLSAGSTDGIHGSTTRTQKVEIEGPGVFNIYQVHMVYAHCVTSAGALSRSFKYAKTMKSNGKQDLYFISSIATDTVVPVITRHSVAPLGWEEIQVALLMNGYDPDVNGGRFGFDFRAVELPGGRY